MTPEGNFNKTPGNQYHGDPSLPYFHYLEPEKQKMREELMKKKGMTEKEADAEIARIEKEKINKLTKAKLAQERKEAA